MKVKITRQCFSLSEQRILNVGEVIEFDKEKAEAIIKDGFAESAEERKTKERKIKAKTK